MKKLTDLASIIADTLHRKRRAAEARGKGGAAGLEAPRDVYKEACATIAGSLVAEGFKFARSGPHATRQRGDFSHCISFQSSLNNVAGEHVALWIHATVSSKRLRDWRRRHETGAASDILAGGQIGNLEPEPGLREWDLADPATRFDVVGDAIATIRAVAMPFFERFVEHSSVLASLNELVVSSLTPVSAIQFALASERPDLAQSVLERFFRVRPDLLPEYQQRLSEYHHEGVPPFSGMGYAKDLAKATILYGLHEAHRAP